MPWHIDVSDQRVKGGIASDHRDSFENVRGLGDSIPVVLECLSQYQSDQKIVFYDEHGTRTMCGSMVALNGYSVNLSTPVSIIPANQYSNEHI